MEENSSGWLIAFPDCKIISVLYKEEGDVCQQNKEIERRKRKSKMKEEEGKTEKKYGKTETGKGKSMKRRETVEERGKDWEKK